MVPSEKHLRIRETLHTEQLSKLDADTAAVHGTDRSRSIVFMLYLLIYNLHRHISISLTLRPIRSSTSSFFHIQRGCKFSV